MKMKKQITKKPYLIKAFLNRKHMTQSELETILGISSPTMRDRIKYGNWKLEEIPIVVRTLELNKEEQQELFMVDINALE